MSEPLDVKCPCFSCAAPRFHRCVVKRWRTAPDGLLYVETSVREKPHTARVRAAEKAGKEKSNAAVR